MSLYRTGHDLLGERQAPAEALYGIATVRALGVFRGLRAEASRKT